MRNGDATAFDALHAIAKATHDDTAQRRYYRALMRVRDPELAQRAVLIALSDEIPPQAANTRINLVMALADEHAPLAWVSFRDNADVLLSTNPKYAPLITSQYVPETMWEGAPLDQLEAWIRSRVPAEMAPNVARGMEAARGRQADRELLVPAADAYVSSTRAG
jgi:hypothetical protein